MFLLRGHRRRTDDAPGTDFGPARIRYRVRVFVEDNGDQVNVAASSASRVVASPGLSNLGMRELTAPGTKRTEAEIGLSTVPCRLRMHTPVADVVARRRQEPVPVHCCAGTGSLLFGYFDDG